MAHAASVFRSAVGLHRPITLMRLQPMLRAKIAPTERDILIKVVAHVVVHELVQPFYDELGGGLPLGDIFQLEVAAPARWPDPKAAP